MPDLTQQELLRLLDEDRQKAPKAPGERIHWDLDDDHMQVLFADLDEASADEVIRFAITRAQGSGKEFEWKHYTHDFPPDLHRRLEAAGLAPGEAETVLVLPLDPLPAWAMNPELQVREVTTFEQVEVYQALSEAVFQKDYSYTAADLRASLQAGRNDHLGFIAYDGEVPVGMARLYPWVENHFGGLYGGGVIESYRGRGFYRALLAARVRRALELGCRRLLIDALPTSRPIVERLGFLPITKTTPFTVPVAI